MVGSLSRRKTKVPGTKATVSYRKPTCEKHGQAQIRREAEGWVCLGCADEFLAKDAGLGVNEMSRGGVHLPSGVSNPAPPKFSDVMPSRRVRRRYK